MVCLELGSTHTGGSLMGCLKTFRVTRKGSGRRSPSFSAPHAHDSAPEQFFWQSDLDTLYQDHVFRQPKMASEFFFMQQPEFVRNGFNRTRWYWRFDTTEKYQQSMRGYYRMISGIDLEIGRIRRMLESQGIADNTIIIFTSDNGYFTGERQLAGKWLMYEPSIRVPLIPQPCRPSAIPGGTPAFTGKDRQHYCGIYQTEELI